MAPFTSDELVEKVARLAFLPDAHELLVNSAAGLLAIADEEIETLISERVKSAREEHWSKFEDIALVPGTLRYRIPRRALGRAVRAISLVNLSNGQVSPLSEIDVAVASAIPGTSSFTVGNGVYYIEDDFIVFPLQPPSGYALRVRYLRRPSRLVPVSSAAAITKATDTTHITLATVPAALAAAVSYVDIVRGDAPFDLMYVDLRAKAISVPGDVQVLDPIVVSDFVNLTTISNDRQDYLCLRDQTVYPQLPAELHPVLESAVVRRVMGAIRDTAGAEEAQATLQQRASSASAIIEPRNQDRSRPLVNRFSALRGGSAGRRRWPS